MKDDLKSFLVDNFKMVTKTFLAAMIYISLVFLIIGVASYIVNILLLFLYLYFITLVCSSITIYYGHMKEGFE